MAARRGTDGGGENQTEVSLQQLTLMIHNQPLKLHISIDFT
jgi:hypothetical protein